MSPAGADPQVSGGAGPGPAGGRPRINPPTAGGSTTGPGGSGNGGGVDPEPSYDYIGAGLWSRPDGSIYRLVDDRWVHVPTQGCPCPECMKGRKASPGRRDPKNLTTRRLSPEEVKRRQEAARRQSSAAARARTS